MPSSSRPGIGQVARRGGTAGEDDRVELLAQLVGRDVDTDVDAGAEDGAFGLHLREAAVDVPLLHLELGNAVAQQAADAVGPLEHRDRVPGARELLRCSQTRRTRPDDGDLLAGEVRRRAPA